MESSIDSDLFSSNVRLVYALAKRYSSNEVDHEDVVQDGKLGLFLATKTFEENKGVAFSTWANYWIKAFILRGQVKFTYLKWPNKKYLIRNKVLRFCNLYYNKEGETPTLETIIENLEDLGGKTPVTTKDIVAVYQNMHIYKRSFVSTQSVEGGCNSIPQECAEDTFLVSQQSAEDKLVNNRTIDLSKCIYRLRHFERFIIEKRYIDPNEYTLEEIRDLWHDITGKYYTREWIRQKEKSALKQLKKYLEELDE